MLKFDSGSANLNLAMSKLLFKLNKGRIVDNERSYKLIVIKLLI